MLCEAPRQLRISPRMWRDRLVSKTTWKSSRNISSNLTCTSCVGGATTVPFGPITGPGRDNDGGLNEVPLRSPKNSLTAPSTSPVVYKSRPVLQNQLKRSWIEPSYQVQERCLRTPPTLSAIYPRFPRWTERTPLRATHTSPAPFSRNTSSRVSGGTDEQREQGEYHEGTHDATLL